MKKLIIAIAAVLVSVASYAQGTVSFNTRITGVVDAPVTLGSAAGAGPGALYSAELVLVGDNGSITPIPGSITTFRTSATAPALEKYVVTVPEVAIPGVPTGGSANVAFRAWLTSAGSYDAAPESQRGMSAPVTVTGLGGGPTPPANLVGLQGFVIPVPEPSTIALGALGAAALLLRRRK